MTGSPGKLSGRIARGSAWITLSRALVNLLGFVSTIVLARLLVPADFGLIALGTTMLAIVNAMTSFSLNQALIQHKSPTDDHFHSAWTLSAARGLLIATAFSLAAVPLARFYDDPRLANVIYALSFSIFMSGLANPRRIILQKKLIFWQDFVLNVSQKLVGAIVGITIALIYQSYWALIASVVAAQAANVLISYCVLPFRPRITLRHVGELWSFSVWLTLSQAVNTLNWRFDQLLIGKFLGRSELGYYTVGDNLASLPTREATIPLTQTLFPAFATLAGDASRLRDAYQRAQSLVTAIALPVGVIVTLVAEPLVRITMGEKWLPAVTVIEMLAAVFAIQMIGSLVQPLGMALGKTRTLFLRDTQIFLFRVPTILIGMYFGGLHGVLIARIVTGTSGIFLNMMLVRQFIDVSIARQLLANVRAIVSVLCMTAGAIALRAFVFPFATTGAGLLLEIGATVMLAALLYGAVSLSIWALGGRPKGPETEMINAISKGMQSLKRARDRG